MQVVIAAEPEPIAVDPSTTAIVIIDMQRDFLERGGFGESLGNNVGLLSSAIGPCAALLAMARERGILIIHTREGHRPDLSEIGRAHV
jgi:nicotinamidase-related amidase